MFIKSIALAAALLIAPAAIVAADLGGTAHAQTQGGGGGSSVGSASGGGGSSGGELNSPTGIAMFAKVPSSTSQRPNTPPFVRTAPPQLNNMCANHFGPAGGFDCAPR